MCVWEPCPVWTPNCIPDVTCWFDVKLMSYVSLFIISSTLCTRTTACCYHHHAWRHRFEILTFTPTNVLLVNRRIFVWSDHETLLQKAFGLFSWAWRCHFWIWGCFLAWHFLIWWNLSSMDGDTRVPAVSSLWQSNQFQGHRWVLLSLISAVKRLLLAFPSSGVAVKQILFMLAKTNSCSQSWSLTRNNWALALSS